MAELQKYGNNSNSYVIVNALQGGKHVIIDTGQVENEVGERCLDSLLSEMGKDGVKVEDIGLILLTHAHPDHYGATKDIKERSNALVAINKEEDEYRRTIGERTGKMFGIEMPEFEPNFYLKEGELNLDDGISLQILLTPGHSPGHVSIYWPEKKVLIAGDVIFYGSTGRVDLPGGSAEALKESIEKLSQLEIEYLLTGHQYGGPGIIEGEEDVKRNFDFVRREVFPYL